MGIGATVVLMAGLPASGKTTTAERLHARIGGELIRSCDVYQALGIVLPDWVRQTRGFTVNVEGYDRLRDQAYVEMGLRLETALAAGASLVIVDAVHGEPDKRAAAYAICDSWKATPILVHCRCEDSMEVARRFRSRNGREHEPPNEASDLSVFRDIARRWSDPAHDRLSDGRIPTVVLYETASGAVTLRTGERTRCVDQIIAVLDAPARRDGLPIYRAGAPARGSR
jgi:predicted kinase